VKRHPAQHSDLLFWGLPVLSGIAGAIVLVAAGPHGMGTVGYMCLAVLVIYPPIVVGVHASRRGLSEDRVGMLIIKSCLLMLVVVILTAIAIAPIVLAQTFGGT
jgi:hypothetical protein